jgi:hypothetical protein
MVSLVKLFRRHHVQYIWYIDNDDILLVERIRSSILLAHDLAKIMQPVLQHYDTVVLNPVADVFFEVNTWLSLGWSWKASWRDCVLMFLVIQVRNHRRRFDLMFFVKYWIAAKKFNILYVYIYIYCTVFAVLVRDYWIHHSVCYTVLFATLLVVITISRYTDCEYRPPDILSQSGPSMSSLLEGYCSTSYVCSPWRLASNELIWPLQRLANNSFTYSL